MAGHRSEHHATIEWRRASEGFRYEDYNREHEWRIGGTSLRASAAPAFLGRAGHVDPEEAFVASLSSCHMLTFLAICARRRWVVDRYLDHAVGVLEPNADGRLAVTRVTLSPDIRFADPAPDADERERMHRMAHRDCFIANSVATEIRLDTPEA